MKYRRKPVELEVVQYTDDNLEEISAFMNRTPIIVSYGGVRRLEIATLEGRIYATPGDFIVKGVKGEFWPVKPDIFELTYEALPEKNDNKPTLEQT